MSVWTVIPHWGDPAETLQVVAALLQGDVQPQRIVVVDNQGGFPVGGDERVSVLRPGRNLGYAAACVLGGYHALEGGAEWVWYVNNDAKPEPDCLKELLAAGGSNPRAGLLSPVIALPGRRQLWYAGGNIDLSSMRVTHVKRPDATVPHDVPFVTGCALLARARFIQECEPMDSSLFMYFEDVDWCIRAHEAGWRTVLVPSARVTHDVEYARDRRVFSPMAVYYMTRNRLLLARRWGSLLRALVVDIDWGGRQLAKCRSASAAAGVSLALAIGLLDGLLGVRGPVAAALARRL